MSKEYYEAKGNFDDLILNVNGKVYEIKNKRLVEVKGQRAAAYKAWETMRINKASKK